MEGNCQFCSTPFSFQNQKIDLFCGHSACKQCLLDKLLNGFAFKQNSLPIPPPPVPTDGHNSLPTPPPPAPTDIFGGFPTPPPPVPMGGFGNFPTLPPHVPMGGFGNFPTPPPFAFPPNPGFVVPGLSMVTPPYVLPINFKGDGEFFSEATNAIFTVKLIKINYDKVPVLALEKTHTPLHRMVNDSFLPQDLSGIAEPNSTRWNNYQFSLGRYQPEDKGPELLIVTVVLDQHPDRNRKPLENPLKTENFVGTNEFQAYYSRPFRFKETYFSGRERRVITF